MQSEKHPDLLHLLFSSLGFGLRRLRQSTVVEDQHVNAHI